jgi:uncharacterized protein (DUF302 family)
MTETQNGLVRVASRHSVEETISRIETFLREKGIKLFAMIDHSGEAERAGLKMPATKLLIFGNAKAGTPVMIAAPSSAIDLPLKVLVQEAESGGVWVSYNTPEYIQQRHGFPPELMSNLAGVRAVVQHSVE